MVTAAKTEWVHIPMCMNPHGYTKPEVNKHLYMYNIPYEDFWCAMGDNFSFILAGIKMWNSGYINSVISTLETEAKSKQVA